MNLFKKKKKELEELILPKAHEEELIRLTVKYHKAKNEHGYTGSIIERRAMWAFIESIFPKTKNGTWGFDIPVSISKSILIKEQL